MEEKKRSWDWISGLIVLFLVGVVAARLSVTNWSPSLWMMDILAFFGVILGLMLGASKFKPRTVFLISAAYTFFFLLWQLGLSLSQEVQWSDKMLVLFNRIWANVDLFFKDNPVTDPLLFLSLMGLLVWFLSLITGYQTSRYGKPWWSIIILTVLLIVVDYYHPFLNHRNRYSGIFFFLIVLLLARLFLLRMRRIWAEKNVMEDSETGINLTKWAFAISILVVLVAWSMPIVVQALTLGTPAQQKLKQSWGELRDRLSNAVAGLTNQNMPVNNFYGNSIDLGSRAATGDDQIYKIEIPDTEIAQGIRYYWKSRSYDLYTGGGWVTSFDREYLNSPDDWRVRSEEFENQTSITLTISSVLSLSRTIVSPGVPINFSRAVQVQTATADAGEQDILGLMAQPPLSNGETYRVQARLNTPTIKQLRETGEDYPGWVKNRYLVLPEEFSPRVINLAQQITTGLDNPYDKAEAITQYLRKTITFVDVVRQPPAGVDAIEWFLFDYQKGFCNYYASAEVLLLRAVGVPARLSVGFAEGQYDDGKFTFTVRRRDSHAWPEVYFVGVGWVEFEPTTSQPERVLPGDKALSSNDLVPNYPAPIILDGKVKPEKPVIEPNTTPKTTTRIGTKVVRALVILLIMGVIAYLFYRLLPGNGKKSIWIRLVGYFGKRGRKVPEWLENLSRKREQNQLQSMYQWISQILSWLGKNPAAGTTPAERISLLIEILPETEEPGRIFLHEYELSEYSEHPADMQGASQAGRQIIRAFLKFSIRRFLGMN